MQKSRKSLQSIIVDGLFKMSLAGVIYGLTALLVYIIS